MDKLAKLLSQLSLGIATCCTAALGLTMVLQIFFRKILNNSLSWTDEMGAYLLAWIAMFGAVTVLYEGKHLAINALTERFAGTAKTLLSMIANCFTLIFVVIVFYYGIPMVIKLQGMYAVSLPIPKSLIYIAMPLTALFSIIVLFNALWMDCKTLKRKGEKL